MRALLKSYLKVISSAYARVGEKMKELSKVLLLVGLIAGFAQPALADSPSKPTVISFRMTPDTVDISTANTLVSFTLVVSNPTGIATTSTKVTLTDGGNNNLITSLVRADSPVKSALTMVTFQGSLTIPSNISSGAYFATADPITALDADGRAGLSTEELYATSTSKVVGAEDGLLVRKGGDLNYNYSTFRGPAYDKTLGLTFTDPKFNTASTPIWKVGESFNPKDYYELTVPTLSLKVKANTPAFCSSDGATVKFVAVGSCSFTVFTDKTLDYQYQKSDQVVNVTAARPKPTYVVGSIGAQSSAVLPLSIQGPFIYGPVGLVMPTSATPTVCYPVGTYITLISGGTCTLNYFSAATDTYAASDVYPLTFEITRTAQAVSFSPPAKISLASKSVSLSATATSGGVVTFKSDSPTICSVTGSSLNLLASGTCQVEALQGGSATLSPASVTQSITVTGPIGATVKGSGAKKIVCVKNGTSKTFAGAKCPVGYRPKK
jgi:hypothetical protein